MKISMISIDVSVDIDVTATAAAQFDWMDACAIHTTIEEEKADLSQDLSRRTIVDFSHSRRIPVCSACISIWYSFNINFHNKLDIY